MAKKQRIPGGGEIAPDFVLKDQNGKDFTLSELKGRRVLLLFHPLAWTEICALQMQSLEENKGVFESLNTVPVGLSVDPVPSKKRGPIISESRVYACYPISGHTDKLRTPTGFLGRKTVSRREQI